jgi:hypothetical protein
LIEATDIRHYSHGKAQLACEQLTTVGGVEHDVSAGGEHRVISRLPAH